MLYKKLAEAVKSLFPQDNADLSPSLRLQQYDLSSASRTAQAEQFPILALKHFAHHRDGSLS